MSLSKGGAPDRKPHLSIFEHVQHHGVNPFLNATAQMTAYEQTKLHVGYFTLIPVRLVGLGVTVVTTSIACKLLLLGLDPAEPMRPGPVRTRLIRLLCRISARAILFWFGYYYIPSKGRIASVKEAPIVVANHTTFLEPLYLLSRFVRVATDPLPRAFWTWEHQ